MFLFSLFLSLFCTTPEVVGPPTNAPEALYISHDLGKSWFDFTDGLPEDTRVRGTIEHQGDLFLSTYNYGIFIMPEGGCEWEPRRGDLPWDDKFYTPLCLAAYGDHLVLGTYYDGVYVSKDGGKNWYHPILNVNEVIGCLLFKEDGSLLAGTHGGLFESFDYGNSWRKRGEDVTAINALSVHNEQLFIARQNGMGVMKGEEIIWSDLESKWALIQLLKKGEYLYTISSSNEVYRTKDGVQWEAPGAKAKEISINSLPEAIWSGYVAQPPTEERPGTILETSRGWIMGVGGGC